MDFLKQIVKEIGDEFTELAAKSDQSEQFIDTGCYMLNAVLSGSIYKGVSRRRITAFAGEEATGKTFFSLAIVSNFLKDNPKGYCLYFDTEHAITKDLLIERGIDPTRVVISEVDTVEQFRSKALQAVDIYSKLEKDNKPPCMFVLDSLGMLSSEKEVKDILNGDSIVDMTKPKLLKGTFRVLTSKIGREEIPFIVANHTYDTPSLYSTKKMSGGSGLKYAASTVAFLSSTKDKDGKTVLGNYITVKMDKSRLTKQHSEIKVKLHFDSRGLDKYYGLLDLGEAGGLWARTAGRYVFNGVKVPEKTIYDNPEKYFTKEVLDQLDEVAAKVFKYGEGESAEEIEETLIEETE